MKTTKNTTTFEELLDSKYGKIGSDNRDEFEVKAKAFIIGEMVKQLRKEANMTQEILANKIGTKKSYISRLENGKIDLQLSTLYKIFEEGFGKRITFNII